MSTQNISYDILIPVYNEKNNIERMLDAIHGAIKNTNNQVYITFINDGSTDGTRLVLDTISEANRRVNTLHLENNQGKTAAIQAGLEQTKQPYVVTMDGDMQYQPVEITKLTQWLDQYRFVNGYRTNRADGLVRLVLSWLGNSSLRLFTDTDIIDSGCCFRAFDRRIMSDVPLFAGRHRFLPILVNELGYAVKQVGVTHNKRYSGTTAYPLGSRLKQVPFDILGTAWLCRRLINSNKIQSGTSKENENG